MKQKKCKFSECGKPFAPFNSLQQVCPNSIKCALGYAEEKKAARFKKETHQMRRKFLDTDIKHWKKKAQAAFHSYVRERDNLDPCISCGRFHDFQYHAGHYRTRHSQTAIQFHPWNCNKQCAPCNTNLSGNIPQYRKRLIEKIGLGGVEYIELDHGTYKWTLEDYKGVHWWYTSQLKQLQQEAA